MWPLITYLLCYSKVKTRDKCTEGPFRDVQFFSPFFPNLVAHCTPSVPIPHIAVDTTALSLGGLGHDFRERCAFFKLHRLKFPATVIPDECKQGSTVYGYPTAPAESSPLPQSVSRALLFTAIQQPLLTPPPSLRV